MSKDKEKAPVSPASPVKSTPPAPVPAKPAPQPIKGTPPPDPPGGGS